MVYYNRQVTESMMDTVENGPRCTHLSKLHMSLKYIDGILQHTTNNNYDGCHALVPQWTQRCLFC
jgi:hypothetical protein